MLYRLSSSCILEVTNEVRGVEILQAPYQFVYQFNYNKPVIELFLGDGETTDRSNGFSAIHDNTILNPTPNFFYNYKYNEIGGFHFASRINHVLNSDLSGQLQYVKCRLLFISGFSYDVPENIGHTLRIFTDSVKTVNFVQMVDYADNTKILPCVPVMHESDIYNSCIEFEMLDINYLFESSNVAIVELKELLFGGELPDTYKVEFSKFGLSDVVDYTFSTKVFKRIIQHEVNTQSFDILSERDNIENRLSFENRSIKMQLVHERFDLAAYIERNYGEENTVFYDTIVNSYSSSNAIIGTSALRLMNISDNFAPISYVPQISDITDHIHVTVKAVLVTSGGLRVERSSTITITDLSTLKTPESVINVTHEKVYNRVVKNINKIQANNQTPNVVRIPTPIYVQNNNEVGTLELYPVKQTVKLNLSLDQATTVTYLKIGNKTYKNIDAKIDTFSIDESAYYSADKTFYILDFDQSVIATGSIIRK